MSDSHDPYQSGYEYPDSVYCDEHRTVHRTPRRTHLVLSVFVPFLICERISHVHTCGSSHDSRETETISFAPKSPHLHAMSHRPLLDIPDFSSFCSTPPTSTPAPSMLARIGTNPCATLLLDGQSGYLANSSPNTRTVDSSRTGGEGAKRRAHCSKKTRPFVSARDTPLKATEKLQVAFSSRAALWSLVLAGRVFFFFRVQTSANVVGGQQSSLRSAHGFIHAVAPVFAQEILTRVILRAFS